MRLLLIALLSLTLLPSCATILSDSDYPVVFDTDPSGGDLTIRNEEGKKVFKGSAPVTLTLPAGNGSFDGQTYEVEASMAGYEPVNATFDTKLDGWYFGNILFGGLLGILIIDPATGAMWRLDDSFTVSMDGQPVAATPAP